MGASLYNPTMAGGGSRFLQYVMIMMYSAGIVALGAHELNIKYLARKDNGRKSASQLIEELHGDVDVRKASISPKYVEEAAKNRKEDPHDKELDKASLNKLLNKLVP